MHALTPARGAVRPFARAAARAGVCKAAQRHIFALAKKALSRSAARRGAVTLSPGSMIQDYS
jgi:hypothetical protein